MRYCVALPCFFGNTDLADSIRKIAAFGYDAAEIYHWKAMDFNQIKCALEESGVELLSMCTTEFNLTNPDMRQTWLDGLKESCIAAKKLGAKHLITQVGNDTGAGADVQHESIVLGLRAAKPIVEEYGVTVMIEPLNTLVDHPGYYLTSSREAFDIVRAVDCQFVKVVYDIYHQQITEGNIICNVTENLDCIAHLHGAGHPGRHEFQYGEIDYKVVIDAIDKAGYTGALGLEYTPLMDAEESLKAFRRIYANK